MNRFRQESNQSGPKRDGDERLRFLRALEQPEAEHISQLNALKTRQAFTDAQPASKRLQSRRDLLEEASIAVVSGGCLLALRGCEEVGQKIDDIIEADMDRPPRPHCAEMPVHVNTKMPPIAGMQEGDWMARICSVKPDEPSVKK